MKINDVSKKAETIFFFIIVSVFIILSI